jgi:hypothetical protein
MMPKFYVEEQQNSYVTYEVEADSEEEAVDKHQRGESTWIDGHEDDFLDVWSADL